MMVRPLRIETPLRPSPREMETGPPWSISTKPGEGDLPGRGQEFFGGTDLGKGMEE